jgi:hypothetical protein
MRRLHSIAAALLAAAPAAWAASDLDQSLAELATGPDKRVELASSRSKDGRLTLLLEVIGQAGADGSRKRLVRLVTTEPDGSRKQSEWIEGRPRSMRILKLKPTQKEWVHTEPIKTARRRPWPGRNAEELRRAYSSHLEAADFAAMELVEITPKGEEHVVHRRGKDGRFGAVRKFSVADEGVH